MNSYAKWALGCALATITMVPSQVCAQTEDNLLELETGPLRNEIQLRYDAALTATRDQAIIGANDPRYSWASEAKAQCAIAIGYLKGGVRDPISIGKCDAAYRRILNNVVPQPLPVAPPPAQVCGQVAPRTIFFDFDSSTPPTTASETVEYLAVNTQACGWTRLMIVGHTDRSGSDTYNEALAMRRANAVASMLTAAGVNPSAIAVSGEGERNPRVPTIDGERNPQNRRVEVTAN